MNSLSLRDLGLSRELQRRVRRNLPIDSLSNSVSQKRLDLKAQGSRLKARAESHSS